MSGTYKGEAGTITVPVSDALSFVDAWHDEEPSDAIEGWVVISKDQFVEHKRWALVYLLVVDVKGVPYCTTYEEPATEVQESDSAGWYGETVEFVRAETAWALYYRPIPKES